MLFNSYLFLGVFLPIVVACYWLIVRRAVGWSIAALLVASYVLYVVGEQRYFWLILVSIAVNFTAGRLIAVAAEPWRRRLLIAGLGINLAALGYFKYTNFLLDQLTVLGLAVGTTTPVALPIGISFYTFTQIAFLVDVYRRRAEERSLVPYGLFVTYFPHLIAGPILHHKEMLPQFRARARGGVARHLFPGLAMLTIGLAKKTLLADPCGAVASGIFGAAAGHGVFVAWTGAIAYTLQIYFDFSGYSDMALGVSRMLRIDLPINFNSPYRSTSILDFWRRWHITLSRFLRDYLYIPLGGNRRGRRRRYINLFTTMLLGGIWHGAGWTFVVWGALHGAAQTLAHGWVELRTAVKLPRVPALAGWAATMLFVVIAWVPFRAASFVDTLALWRGMSGGNGFAIPALGPLRQFAPLFGGSESVWFGPGELAVMAVASLVAIVAPNSQQLLQRFAVGLDSPGYAATGTPSRLAVTATWPAIVAIGVLLGAGLRSIGRYSEFIYFHF